MGMGATYTLPHLWSFFMGATLDHVDATFTIESALRCDQGGCQGVQVGQGNRGRARLGTRSARLARDDSGGARS
jgi:hypothetical protein